MIVLGIGSNCGNRLNYLRSALQKLKSPLFSPRIEVIGVSPLYESQALLPENAPDHWNQPFLNFNVLCKSDLKPLDLLSHIKTIEASLGRKARGRWAPREIDIDILIYDDLIFESEELKIPHAGLMERPFALLPLADLYPDWKSPVKGPSFGINIGNWVSEWRRKPVEQVPFQTCRSHFTMTEIVGILNLTPDSFSDGGKFLNPDLALNHAQSLIQQGITTFDIGAESTRPGATPITPQEEWRRIEPILKELRKLSPSLTLSIDTRNFETAALGLENGANWINDVTGFESQEMRNAVTSSDAHLVVMHSLTVPPKKHSVLSHHSDPIDLLLKWGENKITELCKLGISRERIIFDPGIGFGKTIEQSWEILRSAWRLKELGVRILIGHSRKSFLSSITSLPAPERDIETLALTLSLAQQGIDFLRVHCTDYSLRSLIAWSKIDGVIWHKKPQILNI